MAAVANDCSNERRLRKCIEGGCITANYFPIDRLFVYGTLRPDSPNEYAGELGKTARHIGRARVPGRLYRVAAYPGLKPPQSDNEWVTGDVFENLTAELFRRLDDYEGADYIREVAQATMEDDVCLPVFLYRYTRSTDSLEWIESGDWYAANSPPFAPG